MAEFNGFQEQLLAFVAGLARDRGMAPLRVLDDLVAGYEMAYPGQGREVLASRWGVTLAQLDEVAAVLEEVPHEPVG